jgi:5-methylcytosine-specific restriction protein A
MTGTCQLCDRENLFLTKHHLIPRGRHNKRVKRDNEGNEKNTTPMCRSCQNQIHSLFTNKQLERDFNTIEMLKANEDVQRWIKWIRKHG